MSSTLTTSTIFVVRKSYKTQKAQDLVGLVLFCCYNLGQNQISFYGWEKTNQAYTFDIGGFVSDKLILEASGGVVSEEWGYDFVVAGDRVNLFLTPEDGKKLKVFTVNGIDRLSEVKDSVYSFTHDGMGQVLVHAEFD